VTVEEVAASVEFLCRPEAAGVNGVALTVDGGASAVVKYFDTP
jgi:NAD(P)-dependent dehydrogenase (short-subunit alcohol dehydrogenase family)